ncbi:MAG: 4-alpha-glucanotransferase [Acidobacteria bacterium]|jgi:4-alpha-glucanotransferase|nr:4-alpha-glucanotransferase [Acidobacteriota bacterium]
MAAERASGLLLHVTSLPGRFGCGVMGREAGEFLGFLAASGQSYWQVLPLGPVCPHWNFSPYSSPSTFAGNEMLVDPRELHSRGWISAAELNAGEAGRPGDFCDLEAAAAFSAAWLEAAAPRFFATTDRATAVAFARFCSAEENWLNDYALFRALADRFGTFQWTAWPADIARREPQAIARWQDELQAPIRRRSFEQFLFFAGWRELKTEANRQGVRLIGDIPFYVNFESADAWACPEIFEVDAATGLPAAVAGVPPDYFSPTGQRWGNPLYRWQEGGKLHAPTLEWWIRRIQHLLRLVDVLRIDHFRGFESFWAIPAAEPSAINGQWRPGPGMDFFAALKEKLGDLPLVAEDLGELTPGVEALRDRLGFPGMKILQFAFDGQPANPYLPHNYQNTNGLVYTGTHDNNTSNGWFYGGETNEATKQAVLEYMNLGHRDEFHWQFIRLALQSVARLAVLPVQDLLGYDERFRMNTPGRADNNWLWRLTPGALTAEIGRRLLQLTELYGRRLPT